MIDETTRDIAEAGDLRPDRQEGVALRPTDDARPSRFSVSAGQLHVSRHLRWPRREVDAAPNRSADRTVQRLWTAVHHHVHVVRAVVRNVRRPGNIVSDHEVGGYGDERRS